MRNVRGLVQRHPGKLIVVEGADGSGKSTQLHLLRRWLHDQGYGVFFTEWNSSALVRETTRKAKKGRSLTPTTFSLIHACDFADRYETLILPHLRAGYVVLCDRYVYTAYTRDIVRGCDPDWVRSVYRFAAKPNLAVYFRAPLEVNLGRILSGRPELKYHEAGLDLGLHSDAAESFRIFQGLIMQQYDAMVEREGLTVMDATRPIPEQQARFRRLVARLLHNYRPPRGYQQILAAHQQVGAAKEPEP